MTDDIIDQAQLEELRRRTAMLPREIDPPAEAWQAIRTAIDGEKRSLRTQRWWQRPAFLAAAALLLVAGSSGITALVMQRDTTIGSEREVAAGRDVLPDRSAPASLVEFTSMENDYIRAANRLSEVLESGSTSLSPETLEKLRESVRVIDAAILEARQALAQDPSNRELMEILSTTYTQKIDLLERSAEMGRS